MIKAGDKIIFKEIPWTLIHDIKKDVEYKVHSIISLLGNVDLVRFSEPRKSLIIFTDYYNFIEVKTVEIEDFEV